MYVYCMCRRRHATYIVSLCCCRAEKAAGLRWLHMQASKREKLWNDLLSVPVVVTSTLAGLGQLSANSCGKTLTVLLTIVNLASAVLISAQRYLSPGEKASTHAAIAADYSKLYRYTSLKYQQEPLYLSTKPQRSIYCLDTNPNST